MHEQGKPCSADKLTECQASTGKRKGNSSSFRRSQTALLRRWQVLQRAATNLLKVYLDTQRLPQARSVLELLCVISPDSLGCRFDLAQVGVRAC